MDDELREHISELEVQIEELADALERCRKTALTLTNPITGIAGAISGHAAALPSPTMNSRRRICDLPR